LARVVAVAAAACGPRVPPLEGAYDDHAPPGHHGSDARGRHDLGHVGLAGNELRFVEIRQPAGEGRPRDGEHDLLDEVPLVAEDQVNGADASFVRCGESFVGGHRGLIPDSEPPSQTDFLEKSMERRSTTGFSPSRTMSTAWPTLPPGPLTV